MPKRALAVGVNWVIHDHAPRFLEAPKGQTRVLLYPAQSAAEFEEFKAGDACGAHYRALPARPGEGQAANMILIRFVPAAVVQSP